MLRSWGMNLLLAVAICRAATAQQLDAPGHIESRFLSQIQQLTFDGLRSGEGYFNADSSLLVFQSEREQNNPFFQIYLLDLETADIERISPGHGKTTCAWIHPDNRRVLFASTHDDPQAIEKQRQEFELRESGQQRRYSWDYDEHFELYVYDRQSRNYQRLTKARGYDAEGSYSPDGQWIAFASNRHAYEEPLDESDRARLEIDQAYFMDIYLMRADGTEVRRLTDTPGYDGGPFFSADGKQICWRRFDEKGVTAEIMTMDVDGANQRQLTRLNAISWAPYFHPSGEYLIFATNVHGFGNFELYLVDREGKSPPVRVTDTDGFDGLASFTSDGAKLTWTSNRAGNVSHLFVADWNHQAALEALGLTGTTTAEEQTARQTALAHAEATRPEFRPLDLAKHVNYLCLPELEGRMTGSDGERKATAYVAAYLDYLGFEPAGENGTWYQTFPFPAGARLGSNNRFADEKNEWTLDRDWRPLTFSQNGTAEPAGVVFAGYGLVAPAEGDQPEYDSYAHLDVQDKWVLMFRYWPESSSEAQLKHLQYHASLRKKAMAARERGARGVIIVSGPNSHAREALVPLDRDFTLATSSLFAVTVRDEVVQQWLASAGRDLATYQTELDQGRPMMGFEIPQVTISTTIEVEQVTGYGRNVVGRLRASEGEHPQAILVGAHVDHLGKGRSGSSLARDDESSLIHYGADDNASGVAAMLEIAEYLADQKQSGKLAMKRDLIIAAWSGEELGLHGSKFFVDQLQAQLTSNSSHPSSAGIYPIIAACLNLDMVGRYDQALVLQGIGSSPYWTKAAEKNAVVGLTLRLSPETQLPTDASSFYRAGVPILSAFTGSHQDYHTPRDTPDKLNYEEAARIARLMGLIARGLLVDDEPPTFVEQQAAAQTAPRANMRAYLGSIPEYGADAQGVLISGAMKGSPAEAAGLQPGDVIVELAGRTIENIYDYTYAFEALRPGQETTIVVIREDERHEFKITPGRR
ncbi:MAG TPA: M28 family peptidase [Pirellulaceae bacterium]|nr:M28 family peptidase [Pirellulaceae bacterium]